MVRNGFTRWRSVLSAATVGVCGLGLMLHGAPPDKGKTVKVGDALVRNPAALMESGSRTILYQEIPEVLPVEAPRAVDYRDDGGATVVEHVGGVRAIGAGELPRTWSSLDELEGVAAMAQESCTADSQCADCNPCTDDECDLDTNTCVHTDRDGAAPIGCDDDLYCTGLETCVTGTCTFGTAVECGAQVCDEAQDACVDPCTVGVSPCDDGFYCTDDECVQAVDGAAGEGVCVNTPTTACGPYGDCSEPTEGTDPVCGDGRCCDSAGNCTAASYGACTGTWLATEYACEDIADTETPNICPTYGGGIAPQGDFVYVVGPISGLACDTYYEIGDDYETEDHAPGAYIDLELLRFAGGVLPEATARWRISVYDENGAFIEDVFWPDGSNDQYGFGTAIKTVDFDPPLPIPTKGFVTWAVQPNFGPDGQVELISTDDIDLGVNDANRMWANGAIIEVGDSGPLDPGARRIAFEIVGTPRTSAPTGACCIATDGTCSMELPWVCEAADNVFQGVGSSCNVCSGNVFVSCNTVDDCWACDAGERIEEHCEAAACPGGTCEGETEADKVCVGGDNVGEPCGCPDGTCEDVSGTYGCLSVPPACTLHACCETGETGGNCAIGFCNDDPLAPCNDYEISSDCMRCVDGDHNTEPCMSDADCEGVVSGTCEPSGETCVKVDPAGEPSNPCPTGWESVLGTGQVGYGHDCEPNCCTQPGGTGGDNCTLVTLFDITVPPVGDPPISFSTTGNNSAATFDEYLVYNSSTIFNPEGGDQDPGWWEGFAIDACANVRVDLCCTDNAGLHAVPNWANLWSTCGMPDSTVGNAGVNPPIGRGRGTAGYARGGPFCDEDNLWMTYGPLPAGTYYYPIYSAPDSTMATASGGGDYQFHLTLQACPEAACCLPDGSCTVVNELDCAALEGSYWLAGLNVPDEPVVTCDFSPCVIGSCCLGPGICEDRAAPPSDCDPGTPSTCMSKSLCDEMPGDYVGGALCSYPTSPCPACAISGATNCQLPDLMAEVLVSMSDLNSPPNGVVSADDFVATATTITTVCAWGAYLSRDETVCTGGEGCDCDDDVTDNFRVRVYSDNGGIPGSVVGESAVTAPIEAEVRSAFRDSIFANTQMYEYQLPLDTAIDTLEIGTTYWIEIANNTIDLDDENDTNCVWHWSNTANTTNNYSAVGNADGYIVGSGRSGLDADMAFCVDQNIDPPADVTGACCDCDDAETCDYLTMGACFPGVGPWDMTAASCPEADCAGLIVPVNQECANAIPITGNQFFAFDNSCSTSNSEEDPPGYDMGADLWYAWTVGCDGRVVVSMCGTGHAEIAFDSALGVYYDQQDPTHCPCESDPGFKSIGMAAEMDEGCNTIHDGGAGIVFPPPQAAENCLTVRVSGFSAAPGRGLVEVRCEESDCFLSAAPLPERLDLPEMFNPISQKVRYISFTSADPGHQQAIKVTFVNLPAPYDTWNGVEMFVGEPDVYCENGGQTQPTAQVPCSTAVGGLPNRDFLASTLQCGPYYADWSALGVVHVFNEGIVPGGVYDVQAIDDTCLLSDPLSYSTPLTVTMASWADAVKDCSTTPCSPPDGSTGIVDVTAVLDKYKNLTGNVMKVRADLEGSPAGNPPLPDQSINITDVTFCLGAFLGDSYPPPGFPLPSLPPCP